MYKIVLFTEILIEIGNNSIQIFLGVLNIQIYEYAKTIITK